MKVWKIERTDDYDYDEYDSMVIVAEAPWEVLQLAQNRATKETFRNDNTRIVEVALSHPGVVVASYHAG